MDIWYYILTPFTWLLQLFYNITGSYGFALIFFAVVVKLILFPFSLKGKKSMIQMNMLSGKMQQIQKKYANDKERQNLGIYRQQLIGKNKLIMRWLSHRGGALDYQEWCAAHPGERFPVSVALGADPATFMGMAGLGDLVLTCTDNQSRNRRFGMMLGQGMDVQSAQEKIGQVVEGYRNTKEVRELAHRFGVEMPITEEIYQVLYCGKNAREAALTLLGRARKDERSSH